jgi:hypothetical protein
MDRVARRQETTQGNLSVLFTGLVEKDMRAAQWKKITGRTGLNKAQHYQHEYLQEARFTLTWYQPVLITVTFTSVSESGNICLTQGIHVVF